MPIYTPLPEGSVRLLRLLPHLDENSHIRCQVFTCTLSDSGSTHPYEALSYVWESADDPQLVSINDSEIPAKGNLHAALSHLRDPFIDRILWIDAICINQEDDEEKGRQVRLMAKIYAKASRVIVWLGKAADNSDHALIAIRKAAEEQHMDSAIGETNQKAILKLSGKQTTNSAGYETQQAILKLLERPWFQRIWVLQEVAAARSILIKCGPTEIDGYAFCACLGALEPSDETRSDLQNLIPQIVYLIRGAVFRPRHESSLSSGLSLGIRPLGELVDMYHTRRATILLDKVYALLGMSSDNPYTVGFEADYKSSWKDLFQKLISFCLSDHMSVSTWDENEIAMIEVKGDIIGEISLIRGDASRSDRRYVEIKWNALSHFGAKGTRSSHFTLQASAKAIKQGDVVCILQGASAPTIIRLYNGYSIIVMIAAPLTDDLLKEKASVMQYRNDLFLFWNWDISQGEDQDEKYEYLVSSREITKCSVSKCDCLDVLDKAVRLWNFGLLLNRLERYKEAAKNFRNAMEFCRAGMSLRNVEKAYQGHSDRRKADGEAFRVMDDLLIEDKGAAMETKCIKYSQTPLSWAVQEGHEGFLKQLLKAGAAIDARDRKDRTLLSQAAHKGHEAVVQQLLKAGAAIDAIDRSNRTPLSRAAHKGHEAVVQQLWKAGAAIDARDQKDRTPLSRAAQEGHEAVVQQLWKAGAAIDAIDSGGRTPLSRAAQAGHEAVVQQLLKAGAAIDARDRNGRTPLSWAAHKAVVQQLLKAGAAIDAIDEYYRTPLSWAVQEGHKAVVQQLLKAGATIETRGEGGRTPLSHAAEGGHRSIAQLLLATGKVNADSKDDKDRTPLSYAAARGHNAVVQLLLATGKVDVDLKDSNSLTPLSYAAKSGHEAIVQLLQTRVKE